MQSLADDDRPVSVNDVTVNEGSPSAVFTVSAAEGQYVRLALAAGRAAAGADYADALEVWDGAAWVASGKVNGTVLNQFSMSEYGGVFRIATTTADSSRTSSPRK